MSLIHEAILTTATAEGTTHIAPLGFRREDEWIVLAPFHPSRTLDNLRATGRAALSHTDDVRVFAGCLTGRRDWPLRFYSRERLFSVAARRGFVEPDLAPLPDPSR